MANEMKQVTYGKVVDVLRELEYVPDQVRSAKTYTVFVHSSREGSIILPVLSEMATMHATHLAMIRRVLSNASLSDAETFSMKTTGEGLRDSHSAIA